MIYLSRIKKNLTESNDFPFSVPAISTFQSLSFTAPVSFFIGANASGKSTLLESIAIKTNRIVVGGKSIEQDETLDAIRPLASSLKMSWRKRSAKGFFFRSEDFFNFTRRNKALSIELEKYAERHKADHFAREAMLGQKTL